MSTQLDKARTHAETWLNSHVIDESTKSTIRTWLNDEAGDDLIASFHTKIQFGTGGLRAIMGIGPNRINQYTVGMITLGLIHYLKKSFPDKTVKVAIAYDSRHNSDIFSLVAARMLTHHGILVYRFAELRPTPLLSFATRYLGCHAGIMITASHNPKEYNGYKVYWQDGAQLTNPHDRCVMEEINKIEQPDDIIINKTEANHIKIIDTAVEEAYFNAVKKLLADSSAIKQHENMPIVYSSLHGTGITMVPRCLAYIGFKNCITVEEQSAPNGDFPTVSSPNPEEPSAMAMAIALAKKKKAELIMATDPDADRVGIGVKDEHGEFLLLNGNQLFSLMVWFLLSNAKGSPKTGYIVKTIVTTDLVNVIAARHDVACYDTLTGFKYIAAEIKKRKGLQNFLMAGEESYGFLLGDFVRDKDAVSTCAFIAYMAAVAKHEKKTLHQWLLQLYVEYGLYQEQLFTVVDKSIHGMERMKDILDTLYTSPPACIGGKKITRIIDFRQSQDTDLTTGKVKLVNLPKSNVLQWYTEEGSKISIRPSGTEPKMKIYINVRGTLNNTGEYTSMALELNQKINAIKDHVFSLLSHEEA